MADRYILKDAVHRQRFNKAASRYRAASVVGLITKRKFDGLIKLAGWLRPGR
jgi:hypothetical protein